MHSWRYITLQYGCLALGSSDSCHVQILQVGNFAEQNDVICESDKFQSTINCIKKIKCNYNIEIY
jgi:ATP adenylyltransferase/5',5'''-P-1,P-4-tetraphosphate phosphorylase II